MDPGLKFVHGVGFQWDAGLIFKIKERLSIIPRFGIQTYEYEPEPSYYNSTGRTSALNICLTLRYEFCKKLTQENTRFEYDPNSREFNHYYFIGAFRPFAQVHLGSFTGFGGGVSYYLFPQLSIGIGADCGWNWIATADDRSGFAVIAPKAVVTFCFN
jgi:hypothetical protein